MIGFSNSIKLDDADTRNDMKRVNDLLQYILHILFLAVMRCAGIKEGRNLKTFNFFMKDANNGNNNNMRFNAFILARWG